jgi:hypothetical protein
MNLRVEVALSNYKVISQKQIISNSFFKYYLKIILYFQHQQNIIELYFEFYDTLIILQR